MECQHENCNREFDSEHGMKIHFGRKHKNIRTTTVICDYCGEETKQYSKNEQRNSNNFCDNECYGKWRSGKFKGENSPRYNRVLVECENCDNNLSVQKNEFDRTNNHFCDKDCYSSWRKCETSKENLDYGKNWDKISSKVRERDGKCVKCKISNNKCVDKYGCQLHVHHITPLREFSNIEKANNMQNLVSLCPTCHMKVESNNGDT
jgi:hypothetical protein